MNKCYFARLKDLSLSVYFHWLSAMLVHTLSLSPSSSLNRVNLIWGKFKNMFFLCVVFSSNFKREKKNIMTHFKDAAVKDFFLWLWIETSRVFVREFLPHDRNYHRNSEVSIMLDIYYSIHVLPSGNISHIRRHWERHLCRKKVWLN